MDYNNIVEGLVGTSPVVAVLVWYILSVRKTMKDDKEYNRAKDKERETYEREREKEREKVSIEREQSMRDILIRNHDVIDNSQDVMISLSNKYDDLKKIVEKGFTEINKDVKHIYKKLGDNDD